MGSEQYCSANPDCVAFSNGCSNTQKCMNSEFLEKNPPVCCELGYCGIVEEVKCKCNFFKCVKE